MAKITYVEHNGTEHTVDVPSGSTLMEGAVGNAVPGIDGDCGGAGACGTCHVIIDPEWFDVVGPPEPHERSLLEFAAGAGERSRLACQIESTPELHGLRLRMPITQR
jgi:2Fe-2S ferredoxin